jgi:hypothetical protein
MASNFPFKVETLNESELTHMYVEII